MTEIHKITLQFPSLRAFLAEYGERMSVEGMLLRSEAPPATGSTVDVEVIVAEGMRLLRARGETLWSGAAGTGGGRKAAAIRFQELDDASRLLISRIVEQRGREGGEPFNLDAVPGPREARLRDLTVPEAAVAGAPTDEPSDSVFDLAEPPAETTADLLSAAPEASAAARQPAAPVPLLAGPEPTPFNLGEPESPAAGPLLDAVAPVERSAEAAPESAAHSDLSDLFGGDEPEMAPARGRTEAFPPSFVDEVEAELEAVPESEPRAEAAGEAPSQSVGEVEPEPQPEIDFDPEAAIDLELAAEPSPAVGETPPVPSGESLEVAADSEAAHGPETVEIPVVKSPIPAEETPPSPVDTPPSLAPDDDNLLSIPEFSAPAVETPAVGGAQPELPPPASLRGAASRSRHVGTYFLIALLVGALAVAGYFLLGLVRGGEGSAGPAEQVVVPVAPAPEKPVSEAPAEASADDAEAVLGVGEETTATEVEASAAPEPMEPAAPAAPLTGLDRITWNETDSETVLTLAGDGAIAAEQVELVPITGENPRLVIKVSGVTRPFEPAELVVGTSQVRRVRTGLQTGGALHVVVDLVASGVSVRDLAIRGSRIEVRLGAE